jgi:predicted SprT family Zn-dependent metalloprotease
MSKWLRVIIFIAYSAGIAVCIYFITSQNLTSRESGLVGVILAIISILASWTVSHYYSESQHTKALKEVQEFHRTNLKTYARKAAEKVNNLSNELSRLSAYLEKELTRTDYDNVEEELNAKEERIESAIHITNTLKSINDTALSDWEGVISDELEQRRVEQQEREEELEDLLTRYDTLMNTLQHEIAHSGDSTLVVQKEIDSLRKELHFLASRIGIITPSSFRLSRASKNTVEVKCPICHTQLTYRQKAKENSVKALKCPNCETRLVSRYNKTEGFILKIRNPIKEKITCPKCSASIEVELDPMPSSTVSTTCPDCNTEMRIVRTPDGFRITQTTVSSSQDSSTGKPNLNEEIIQQVRNELPVQPWPKGTHKLVATKLNLTNREVFAAINELIKRGIFNPQIDGKLYFPDTSQNLDELNK